MGTHLGSLIPSEFYKNGQWNGERNCMPSHSIWTDKEGAFSQKEQYKSKWDGEHLFKDAFLSVCFWLRPFPVFL